ncbi:5151_t:CDS:2 [Dentiscutata heterogama]|uniref:5151_t:CDS:1 n=1 Tax=Dentiscutata heterogama TaxID=1316150 RepID=A0ACA9MHK7_9GLOM|nr:5151_t:CDS:2 [Dentiscutata heterogama]
MTIYFLEQLSCNLDDLLKNSDEYNVIIEVGQPPNSKEFKIHTIILNSCFNVNAFIIIDLLIASNKFGLKELRSFKIDNFKEQISQQETSLPPEFQKEKTKIPSEQNLFCREGCKCINCIQRVAEYQYDSNESDTGSDYDDDIHWEYYD